MKYLNGNLIELAKQGHFDVIIHGCNCYNTMRSGIAKQIANAFPEVVVADNEHMRGDPGKLGNYTYAEIGNLTVVNAYTQYRYGTDKRHTDYEAVRRVMRLIKTDFTGKRLGMPKIGAGLGGGDWTIIEGIISQELVDEDVTIVILP